MAQFRSILESVSALFFFYLLRYWFKSIVDWSNWLLYERNLQKYSENIAVLPEEECICNEPKPPTPVTESKWKAT